MTNQTLTFVLMDPPFESARSTTALALVDRALRRGHRVNVFAYEGAVCLPFAAQAAHPNAVHGRDVDEEDHPLPRTWIASLMDAAPTLGASLDWVNCGLCVDERGANESINGARRGAPADLVAMIEASENTLVIPTGD